MKKILKLPLLFLLTFLYIQKTPSDTSNTSNTSKKIEKICYDQTHNLIFPKSEREFKKCVYNTKGYTKLFDTTTLLRKTIENKDCDEEDICISSCYKDKCFSIGFGMDTVELKKSWLIKSTTAFGIYIGFVIGFLLILYINQKFELKNFKDNVERSVIFEKEIKNNSMVSYFIEDPDDEISERFTDTNLILEIENMINNNKKNSLKNNYILSKSKSFK